MSISKIQPGMSFSRNFKVRPEWAADRMGSGHVPVLSTAALVLAMENTAASSILPYLEDGTTTVGSRVELVHLYPTPVGEFFTIDLVVAKVDKSRLDFTLTARDEHRVISTGFHRRHVVDTAKFLEKVLGAGDLGSGNSATELPLIQEDGPRPGEQSAPRRHDLDSDDFNDNDTIF
jgi:predicted thioesterase